MSINFDKDLNSYSTIKQEDSISAMSKSLIELSSSVNRLSSMIISNFQSRQNKPSYEETSLDKKFFDKLSKEELLKLLEKKEKQVLTTSIKSVELLLDNVVSKEKGITSLMDQKGIQYADIDLALMNATNQLNKVKQKLFAEIEEKEQKAKNKLELEKLFVKEKEELSHSLEIINNSLNYLENLIIVSQSNYDSHSKNIEKILLEKEEKVYFTKQVTNDLIDSLEEANSSISLAPMEKRIVGDKLFQLKDSSNQCILVFAQLAAFSEATSLFLKESKNFIRFNQQDSLLEKSSSNVSTIKYILLGAQKKLVDFGKFLKSLFIKLFSILSSFCTSACMAPLIFLRRGKELQRKKDLQFLENLFVEGRLSFGSSRISVLARLKLFLKLFGLELFMHTEEGDIDYRVGIDISEKSLENQESLSSIMLALVKYFENFSFDDVLTEIDQLPFEKAREVEEILSSRLEDLFSHNAWIFFENFDFSK